MSNDTMYPGGFSEEDILFDCPECAKSLGINKRGAGLCVRCPDCGTRMRVPTPERLGKELEDVPSNQDVMTGLNESVNPQWEDQVHRLEVSLEEVHRRKNYLEQLRVMTEQHMIRLQEEMEVMQKSLDRMVDIMQDLTPGDFPSET